tara:strand:+ start:11080 stop:11715 length:636 start_codon:yes stop_codon:yes gene_type:complete
MKKQSSIIVFLWFLVIEAVVILTLIPGDRTEKIINEEHYVIGNSFSKDTNDWIFGKAREWYQSSIIDSGLYEGTRDVLIPTDEQKKRSRGMENMGGWWFKWVDGRIDAVANIIFQFYVRVAIMIMWAPYMLVLLAPAIFDGLMTWKIKKATFAYSSPLLHQYSLRYVGVTAAVALLATFAPIVINVSIIPLVLMSVCVMIGIAAGNMQKRI